MYYIRPEMPTYDYECTECNHKFEFFQNMSDDVLTKCPDCGNRSLRRVIGVGSGIIFKGSGFYVNDSKAAKPKPKKEEKKPAKSDSPKKTNKT